MVRKVKNLLCILMIITCTFFINSNLAYALSPASSLEYQGIDVSNWQGYINYNQVKQSGIDVVYIKASQGTNIKDAYFDINYENAKANGLKVGFYHFLTATNVEEARKRSTIFCISNIK